MSMSTIKHIQMWKNQEIRILYNLMIVSEKKYVKFSQAFPPHTPTYTAHIYFLIVNIQKY